MKANWLDQNSLNSRKAINQSWENAFCKGYESVRTVPPVRIGTLGLLLWHCGWKGKQAGQVCGEVAEADLS